MSTREPIDPSLPQCVICATDFTALKDSVARIEIAIVGDTAMGHRGFIQRLDAVEAKQVAQDAAHASMDRKLVTWGGIVTGAVFVLQFLKDRIWK